MDNFGCLNAVVHFVYSISILHEPAKKKLWRTRLQLNLPPPPHQPVALSPAPPSPPFKRTYFVNDTFRGH